MTSPLASRQSKVEEDFKKIEEEVRRLLERIKTLEGEKEGLKKKVEDLKEKLGKTYKEEIGREEKSFAEKLKKNP
jgi:predicted nuclease with TOPRIM domain